MKHTSLMIVTYLLVLMITFNFFSTALASENDFDKQIKKIVDIIQRFYVDKVQSDELLIAAVNGMLSHLDPHSTFLTGEDYQKWRKNIEGLPQNNCQSIHYALLLQSDVGYIKIKVFSSATEFELRNALSRLTDEGMQRLILDLRGNRGGYFDSAVNVADVFLPAGLNIVSTIGRNANSTKKYVATTKSNFRLFPMIVLIDETTASSAEIVAGALQDWNRALIVGQPSFGKGLVLSQYPLSDSSALFLATARYYTPKGRLIQKPHDHYQNYRSEQAIFFTDSKKSLSLNSCDLTADGDRLNNTCGIIPDVFLAAMPSLPDSFQQLIGAKDNYLTKFAENYLIQHPQSRADSTAFVNQFSVTDLIVYQFEQFLRDSNVEFPALPFHRYKERLKILIKKELALICWGEKAYNYIDLIHDNQIQQALLLFNQASPILKMSRSTIQD